MSGYPPGPVLIGVEQLRRTVPGGIGTAAAGLLSGLAQLSEGVRASVALYATVPDVTPDPLWRYELPILASPLPPKLLTWMWEHGRGGPRRSFSLEHATSFQFPPSDAPLVATVHDLGWRHHPDAYGAHGRRWHEAALRRTARRAIAYVVPSLSVADDLAAAGVGADDHPIEVVEWGADHLEPPDRSATDAFLETLGVDGPYLLSVSTIEPRKNLRRLMSAYASARSALSDPPTLLVVGPNGWGGDLPATAGVVCAGAVSGGVLSALYERALGFCYVPLLEGYGLPVVEAMRSGTPVLSTDVPSAGGATLVVDPSDERAIKDAIVMLVTDGELRSRLVSAGAAHVALRTWRGVAERHVAIWREHGAAIAT